MVASVKICRISSLLCALTYKKDLTYFKPCDLPSAITSPTILAVRAGTDLTYILIIVAGVGITGFLLYVLGSELMSTSGPNAVYSAAFKRCQANTEVLDALGAPIKAYGEGKVRRRFIQHTEFITKNGEEHTRVQFHLQGTFRTAIVHAETFKNERGKREFEYLLVECEGYPPKTIQLEKRVHPPQPEVITFY